MDQDELETLQKDIVKESCSAHGSQEVGQGEEGLGCDIFFKGILVTHFLQPGFSFQRSCYRPTNSPSSYESISHLMHWLGQPTHDMVI